MKETWVIKVVYPDNEEGKKWSEYAFSRSLKKYIERTGRTVIVHNIAQWNEETDAEVVIVIRGQKEYFPKRNGKTIYIMWNLSHPDLITLEQYNAYDFVCVGSQICMERLAKQVIVPMRCLPICADTEIFCPADEGSQKEFLYDWIFVGNSKHIKRKSVMWALQHGIPLKIWGKDWPEIIPDQQEHIVADHIHNDDLPELYRQSRATVNDHFDDMLENGFLNTRIIESLACGLPVITDYIKVYEDAFGDCLLYYRNEEEYVGQIHYLDEHYGEQKEKIMAFLPALREKFSFEGRVRELAEVVEGIRLREKAYREVIRQWSKDASPCLDELDKSGEYMSYAEEKRKILQVLSLYRTFMENGFQNEDAKETAALLQEIRESYRRLDWTMRRALSELSQKDSLFLGLLIQDVLNEYEAKRIESVHDLNYFYKDKYIHKWENSYRKMRRKARKYKKKNEASTQRLEQIEGSKNYQLARLISTPVRVFRNRRKAQDE